MGQEAGSDANGELHRHPMPMSAAPMAEREALAGLVERVTFHSPETGFCVLRVKVRGQRDLVTVVGAAAMISPGEFVQASGSWVNDRQHGLQFKAALLKAAPPTTLEGILRYLGSGMIKGIGPVYASKLVQAFGAAVFDIIEQAPERLQEVAGIGPRRAARIQAGWAEQKVVREIMLFLHSHDVGTSRALRIFKTYGADAVQLITANPYRLARDISGIGFRTADQIALRLGIPKTAMIRARAGIGYALAEAMDEGHCAEHGIAERLLGLAGCTPPWPTIDPAQAIPWVERKTGLILAASQREAVRLALRSKLLVITGGPGVGKTTLLNAILTILRARTKDIALAAPTGRAARRLFDATGLEAKTLHRLLEADPARGGFKRGEEHPLAAELVVVDEVSMVDVPLLHSLLKAVPTRAGCCWSATSTSCPRSGRARCWPTSSRAARCRWCG
jgi:exodeoxyribonuclease V alpha subunit